jgi:hypothetical protein
VKSIILDRWDMAIMADIQGRLEIRKKVDSLCLSLSLSLYVLILMEHKSKEKFIRTFGQFGQRV